MGFRKYNEIGEAISQKGKGISDFEESITEQHHEPELNVNNIIKKHGLITNSDISALQNMRFDDVTGNDFQESMNMLIKAKDSFMNLPSQVRKEFDNDPVKFLDFVYKPDSKDKLVE